MFSGLIEKIRGKKKPEKRVAPRQTRRVRAQYDAAVTTNDNRRHWVAASNYSADSENSSSVRETLRERARYETGSNSYAKGIVLTKSNYTIGTGPILQMQLEEREINSEIEQAFSSWACEVMFAAKLRTMEKATTVDGETFALKHNNPMLRNQIKLDFTPFETDRVADDDNLEDPLNIDGIQLDSYGNPVSYRVLDNHPGDTAQPGTIEEATTYSANDIIHFFRQDRPGAHRSVSELTTALPLFAQLRRFILATLGSAEMAASFSGILYTDANADSESDHTVDAMDAIELERNMLLTVPEGWKMGQLDARHPIDQFETFVKIIIGQIARCLEMPLNIALANSADYNYASGRMDKQIWLASVKVRQTHIVRVILDNLFRAWIQEYALIDTRIFSIPEFIETGTLSHTWIFPGHEHVDPLKEANAQKVRLENYTASLADEWAKQGHDYEKKLREIAKVKALMKELGLEQADVQPKTQTPEGKEGATV